TFSTRPVGVPYIQPLHQVLTGILRVDPDAVDQRPVVVIRHTLLNFLERLEAVGSLMEEDVLDPVAGLGRFLDDLGLLPELLVVHPVELGMVGDFDDQPVMDHRPERPLLQVASQLGVELLRREPVLHRVFHQNFTLSPNTFSICTSWSMTRLIVLIAASERLPASISSSAASRLNRAWFVTRCLPSSLNALNISAILVSCCSAVTFSPPMVSA